PVILAAGVYKLPDLAGPLGDGIRGQAFVGSICAAVAAYISVRFLTRWFHTRTLIPFAVYCFVAGIISIVRFAYLRLAALGNTGAGETERGAAMAWPDALVRSAGAVPVPHALRP